MKIHIDIIIYENIGFIIQLNDEKWRKNSVIGVTSFYFLNGRSMISQEFMARDLLARILTQFRWWVHNESVIFVKSHLTLRIEIEFKENLRVRFRKCVGFKV